jgi:DNA mismatch endonuclease (patch repair protein)
MGRVRQRDTAAEVRIRKALHRRGLRYRVDYAPLGGRNRADTVFTRSRIAVFIHGCFWHRCTEHGTLPKANADWWQAKLEANQSRDLRTVQMLESNGWLCLTFWEHDEPEAVADSIERTLADASPTKCRAGEPGVRNKTLADGPEDIVYLPNGRLGQAREVSSHRRA